MYVTQDDPDYIHIVILNYNAKTPIDKHVVQQYKIKDWTGILKKPDKATYCCGLTAQNVLVILDKDIVHYISLTEALRESGMVEETRKCVPGEFPEIPRGEKMLKSIKLTKGNSKTNYTFRGMFNEKSQIKEREGEYDLVINYDSISENKIRSALGFLYLATEKAPSSG
jgi:hypothetical protein